MDRNFWMVKEIREEIKGKIKMYKNIQKSCELQQQDFSDVYHTDDKFEATRHEFWRSRGEAFSDMIADLEDLLKSIDSMIEEEIEEVEEAEEYTRDLRKGNY